MTKLTKFLFPFFSKERHGFLKDKWWFRAVIIIYVVALVISPFIIFSGYIHSQSAWCYNGLHYYAGDTQGFDQALAQCSYFARAAYFPGVMLGIIRTLIVHYLIQLVFFKVIMDYIVLNSSEKKAIEEKKN